MILFADSENFTSITAVNLMRYLLKRKKNETSKSDGGLESSKVCWSGDLIAIVAQKVLMYVISSLSLNILRMLLKVSQTYLQILTIRIQLHGCEIH